MKISIELDIDDAKGFVSDFDVEFESYGLVEEYGFESVLRMSKLVSAIKTKVESVESTRIRPRTIERIFENKAEEYLAAHMADDTFNHPYDDLESIVSLHTDLIDMNTDKHAKPFHMIYGFLHSGIMEIRNIAGDQQFLLYVASLSDEEYESLSFCECIDYWVCSILSEGRG